jgi:putative DNA primase/helicase
MSDGTNTLRTAILAAMPGAELPDDLTPGRWLRFSTDGRRDKPGWCKVFDDLRGAVFGCMRHGISETWTAANSAAMTREQRIAMARQVMAATAEREAQQRRQWAEHAQRNTETLAVTVPLVPGDPVTLYLKRRGFGGVWPLPAALRLHRALPYWHEGEKLGTFPAMVAPVTSPDGRLLALHRTYLTRDGRKADVPTVRKVSGASGPLAGACIALHKPVNGCMGIAEGIETALGAWCASTVPTVAAYCAGNLAAWQWPPGLQRLVIFADHDKAGRESADTLLAHAVRAGLQANVMMPTEPGTDWADVWAARSTVAVET